MSSILCLIDDKHVPLYRILWISDVPHYCGEEDCQCEGLYEVRLEQGESVWGTRSDRDRVLSALEQWHAAEEGEEPWD